MKDGKKYYWDNCNKWLHLDHFIILFDNWFCWLNKDDAMMFREWTLFQIGWDNGAWWGDVYATVMDSKELTENLDGLYKCYVQIILLGIGVRFSYNRTIRIER